MIWPFTTTHERCGEWSSRSFSPVIDPDKALHNRGMNILPRMIAIAVRKYSTSPAERGPAVRMLVRNALRLAMQHLGHEQTASLALGTLQEGRR